jgi:hypothetical protein
MGGWVAAYALAMDPMSALRAEMDYTRPAYAVVMYGTNDLDRITPDGVHAGHDAHPGDHRVLRLRARPQHHPRPPRPGRRGDARRPLQRRDPRAGRGAPPPARGLLARAAAAARKGIDPDGIHPSAYVISGNVACGLLTPEGLRFGYNLRNLVTLFALDRLRGRRGARGVGARARRSIAGPDALGR